MAKITSFILVLLAISTSMLFYKFDYEDIKTKQKEMPNLIFENATMYKINDKEVSSIIKAKKAMNYKATKNIKSKTVMHYGALYSRSKDDKTNSLISADLIIEEDDIIDFNRNVIYSRDDDLLFSTEKLTYDKKRNLAFNDVKFEAKQKSNIFKGHSLIINQNTDKIKAKEVEFMYVK